MGKLLIEAADDKFLPMQQPSSFAIKPFLWMNFECIMDKF